ncbi:MAG: hypothetical protein AAGA85_05255 [Bacteroidota bacterium]
MRVTAHLISIALLSFGCANRAVEDYESKRQSLITSDLALRFDSEMHLSPKEQQVNQRFIALRDSMISGYLSSGFFPPAEPFHLSKQHVEETALFKLLRRMPKGGIHHLHGSAGIDFHWLINRAVEMDDCYVFWDDDTQQFLKGETRFYRQGEAPSGYRSTKDLDTVEGFREEWYDLLVFREETAQDSVQIWDEFEKVFQRINGFFDYQPVFKDYTRSMIDTLRADGLQHVEVRTIFRGGLYDLDHKPRSGYYNADSIIYLLKEVEAEVQAEDPNFTLRSIYTFLRFSPEEFVYQELIKAHYYKKRYPEMIVGFDLVANEDAGKSTYFFKGVWDEIDSLGVAYGTKMDLYLHDGESDWAHVQNLYDAYLLNSKRIGHGFNLMHFPSLLPAIREADICIEVSPLSNQILGYIDDLRIHPANYWLKYGIQCTISSDDPGIFDYNGLSYDFWHVTLAWELDLRALKQLALNSLEYSALDEHQKQQSIRAWESRWDTFVDEADVYFTNLTL